MSYKQRSSQAVVEGGTGVSSNTVYAVLCGGTTTTGPIQSIASVGTSGQVLTSNGAAALPTFQAAAGGSITGPGSSTDNAAARWNGTGGTALQDSTVIINDDGIMTNASQPAFSSYQGTTDANETGNGPAYFLGDTDVGTTLTEIFDQNSDFTDGASGGAYFEAPVTGQYALGMNGGLSGITSSHNNGKWTYSTSNRGYRFQTFHAYNYANGSGELCINMLVFTDMDAADIYKMSTRVSNGTQVVDVLAPDSGVIRTSMNGYLGC